MMDNKTHFKCFIDGQYDTHMRNQTYLDGRRESWAIEAELHAASALYEMNIKVTRKLTTNMRWLTHVFRANGKYANNTALPYANSMHLIFKNCHFNLLHDYSLKKQGEALGVGNKEAITNPIDWFELRSTTKGGISCPQPFFYTEGTEPQTKQDERDPLEKFKVPKKSSFTPNKGRDMWLDMYVEMVKTDIINSLKKLGKLNISPGENGAFLSLLHNDDIVVRPELIGSAVTAQLICTFVFSLIYSRFSHGVTHLVPFQLS